MNINLKTQDNLDAGIQISITSFIGCIASVLILVSLDIPKKVLVPVVTVGVISLLAVFGLAHLKNKIVDDKIRFDCATTEEKINSLIREILSSTINFETTTGKELKSKIKDILDRMLELSNKKDSYGGKKLFSEVYIELENLLYELMRNYRRVYQMQEDENKKKQEEAKKKEQYYQKQHQSYSNNRQSNRNAETNGKSKKQEYLKILGLSGNITDWEYIKSTYRKLCLKYHTDVNKSANALEMIQNINMAYAELEKIYR